MPRPTRAVLLDAGHTLLRIQPGAGRLYAEAARDVAGFEAPVEEYERTFGRVTAASANDLFAAAPSGTVNDDVERDRWQRFTERVYRAVGLVDHLEPLWARLKDVFTRPESWVPYDDMDPTLTELRRRGLRLAIVSNWSTDLTRILARHDLAARFDAVVGSCDVGVEKPDPAIFRLALEALSVDADEAIHVGDSPEADVEGARRAGIPALLLDRTGLHTDAPRRISSLLEILDHLAT